MSEESPMDIEAVTSTVGFVLDGSLGLNLKQAGFDVTSLDDLGEIYIRSNGGAHFVLRVEEVNVEDVQSWGIDFDD